MYNFNINALEPFLWDVASPWTYAVRECILDNTFVCNGEEVNAAAPRGI